MAETNQWVLFIDEGMKDRVYVDGFMNGLASIGIVPKEQIHTSEVVQEVQRTLEGDPEKNGVVLTALPSKVFKDLQIHSGQGLKVATMDPSEGLDSLDIFCLGRIRALRLSGAYAGHRYCFYKLPFDETLLRSLVSMENDNLLVLRSIWPSAIKDGHRYLFELAVHEAAAYLLLDEHWSYRDLTIALIEYFWQKLGRSRCEVYQWGEEHKQLIHWLKRYKKEQPEEVALEVLLKGLVKSSDL